MDEKEPLLSDFVVLLIIFVSNLIVIDFDGAKCVPVTTTVLPAAPDDVSSVIDGESIVNVAVAKWLLSVALTRPVTSDDETVNLAVDGIAPVEVAVAETVCVPNVIFNE